MHMNIRQFEQNESHYIEIKLNTRGYKVIELK